MSKGDEHKGELCNARHLGQMSSSTEFSFKDGGDATRTKNDTKGER